MNAQGSARRAFTLVELLVVIAVVAILIGVLLPSLAGARQVAQSMVGLSNTRQLTIAQQGYAASAEGWLPGPNTSGVLASVTNGEAIVGSTGPDTPTQTFDWISPSMGSELGLSPKRAQRMWQIWERFHCPRATRFSDILFGTAGDIADFDEIQKRTPYRQISYLAPASFHFTPYDNGPVWVPSRLRGGNEGKAWTQRPPFDNPCTLPPSYKPRLDAIDRPDSKVAVADGTRFVTTSGGLIGGAGVILDFDVTPDATTYGGFTTSGPIFEGSRAYGRTTLPLSAGQANVDTSMRYFDREMHVAFFDGHADRITSLEAYSKAEFWYPRGSVFTGAKATEESRQVYQVQEKIP